MIGSPAVDQCLAAADTRSVELTASSTGIVIFSLYLVAIVALGLIAGRYQKNETDFWVAGRRFGLGILVMANMAATRTASCA